MGTKGETMKLFIAIALVAYASALPSPDSTVPEMMMTQTMSMAAKEAKKTVTSMLESGSSDSACAELAATTISEVEDAVKAQQEAVDKFKAPNDGTACLEEGKAEVATATEALDAAKKASEDAAAAAAASAGASVDFGPVALSAMTDSSSGGLCGPWASDPAYTSAKAAAAAGASDAAEKAAAIAGFESALTAAEDAAAAAVKSCECAVFHEYTAAWEAAESHKETNAASYTKGKHMECVLAGTAPDACDVGTVPEVTPVTLAAGVTGEGCPEPAAEAPEEGKPVGAEEGREYPDGGSFGPSAGSSKLCVYTDPSNVDFASGENSEGPAILADLRAYLPDGDARLTEMPNIADMSSKCVAGGTMVIPECERSAISAATAEYMKSYVEAGGTVIFTDDSVGNVATAVHTISGLSWTQGSNSVAEKKTSAARFADTPDTLPSLNGAAVRASSFGEGGNVLYQSSSGDVLVGQIRVGAGQVWWLGFDWFQGNHNPGGCTSGQTGTACVRDGWAQALAAAVGK